MGGLGRGGGGGGGLLLWLPQSNSLPAPGKRLLPEAGGTKRGLLFLQHKTWFAFPATLLLSYGVWGGGGR